MRIFPLVQSFNGKWQVPILENENITNLISHLEGASLNERMSFFVERFGLDAILESSSEPLVVIANCEFFELKGL